MPALYPAMVAAEDFKVGDCVRKFVSEKNVTPFVGTVTQIAPVAQKVWVQWPIENSSESPETLIKVNPAVYGMPTVMTDFGYNSYEKLLNNVGIPKRPNLNVTLKRATATEKMAIRIAHTFATNVIGKLVNEINVGCMEGLTDIQNYNRIFKKFGSICSDYIIRSTIEKIYSKV